MGGQTPAQGSGPVAGPEGGAPNETDPGGLTRTGMRRRSRG
jgi:hypothetical protein